MIFMLHEELFLTRKPCFGAGIVEGDAGGVKFVSLMLLLNNLYSCDELLSLVLACLFKCLLVCLKAMPFEIMPFEIMPF